MPRKKTDLTSRLHQAIAKIKDKNIILNGSSLFCQKCSEQVKYTEHTVNARLREHVNSIFHKKNLSKSNQSLIDAGIVNQKRVTNETNKFNIELIEAFTAADIPFEKINNPKIRSFIEKYTKCQVFTPTTLRTKLCDVYESMLNTLKDLIGENSVYFIVDETTDIMRRCVVNVMVGQLNGSKTKKN